MFVLVAVGVEFEIVEECVGSIRGKKARFGRVDVQANRLRQERTVDDDGREDQTGELLVVE